jgi:hypothetical protein
MDMLAPQAVIMDLKRRHMVQPLCKNVVTPINYLPKNSDAIRIRKLTTGVHVVIPARSAMRVPIHHAKGKALSPNFDYVFHAKEDLPYKGTVYSGLIRHDTTHVLMRNDTGSLIKIPWRTPVGHAAPADIDGLYAINPADHGLAALPKPRTPAPVETRLENRVTVYGNPEQTNVLRKVVMEGLEHNNRHPQRLMDAHPVEGRLAEL